MNEDELEQLCLNWFRDNSWDIAYGPDIAPDSANPERTDIPARSSYTHQPAHARNKPIK